MIAPDVLSMPTERLTRYSGRKIVEPPEDALADFIDTDMPFLCMEGLLVTRR